MTVCIIATLDTKGREAAFVADLLARRGLATRIVDAGCLGQPAVTADVPRDAVFAAAGTSLQQVQDAGDRGHAVTTAATGVQRLVAQWHAAGEVDGVIALGGSAGTTIGTAAMRPLPLDIPKVMVSTLASGQTRPWIGGRNIVMLNSVVDLAGINRISRTILTQAAHALAGMLQFAAEPETASSASNERPLIAASMFGVTTPCVTRAQEVLEDAGYEVLVFHATGNGGESMEGLIDDGLIVGVLDITTTELADELVGGILSAGPNRLTAAARHGIPQVISVGATDMVNFGPPETVPDRFRDRTFYHHNATVTLMRTTPEECRRIGADIGRKAAQSSGPTCILLPACGVSAIDHDGQPFNDPIARRALFHGIRETAGTTEIAELDDHINDPEFADAAAQRLIALIDDAPAR